jgi:hypothetical protein
MIQSFAALLSVPTVSEAFERNRTLIDLNAAPSELQYRVDEVFNALGLCNAIPI